MKTYSVSGTEEYIQRINKIISDSGLREATMGLWYRGHSSESYNLIPSLYRPGVNFDYEREIVREFRLKSSTFSDHTPQSDIGWMFFMRHHGLPTRILDWSESYLVSLYFAVENPEDKKDACVWILNPWLLNILTGDKQSIPGTSSDDAKNYVVDFDDPRIPRFPAADRPMAFRTEQSFRRAFAQRGVATIHGRRRVCLIDYIQWYGDKLPSRNKKLNCLQKISIPRKYKFRIKKELQQMGIGADTVYPDLDGICRSIAFRFSYRMLGEKNRNRLESRGT